MTNEGTADRAIRVVLGIVLIALAWFALGFGTLFGIIAGIVGAVALLTGLVGFCPAYRIVGSRRSPGSRWRPRSSCDLIGAGKVS